MKNSRDPKKESLVKRRADLKNLIAAKAASYECIQPGSLERNIGNETWRKRLINTLLTWASDESSVELVYFFRDYNIARSTFYEWVALYPDLHDAFVNAKLFIAGNRRNGSIKRKFEPNSAYRGLYKFDPEEKEIDSYIADLKKSSGEGMIGFVAIDTSKPPVQSRHELQREKNPETIEAILHNVEKHS